MKNICRYITFAGMLCIIFLTACGRTSAPTSIVDSMIVEEPPAIEAPAPPEAEEVAPAPVAESAALYRTGVEEDAIRSQRSNRMIIKNAEIELLVTDTDISIDGVTQVIVDVGGYLISSRVWYQDWGDVNYKNATLTFGVPADQFERSLRRLRQLAVQVLDETSTGQDVTEEYVDLQSRLESLAATRSRILEFLERAETVEEALKVNDQLAAVEAQIEEVQGRINYLADRAAYSTITVNLKPQLPELIPTPTPTTTATPTATPTSTPEPWDPSVTFASARRAVTSTYQAIVDILIWLVVVVLPVLGPLVIIALIVWRFARRKQMHPEDNGEGGG